MKISPLHVLVGILLVNMVMSNHGELSEAYLALTRAIPNCTISISVSTANTPAQILFRNDLSHHRLTPASNNKIITSWAITHTLGPNYTYKTTLSFDDQKKKGCFTFAGDPSLSSSDVSSLSRKLGSLPHDSRILADTTIFGALSEQIPGSWNWEDLGFFYGAHPAGSMIDHNAVVLIVSPSQRHQKPHIRFENEVHENSIPILNRAITGDKNTLRGRYVFPSGTYLIEGEIPAGEASQHITIAAMDTLPFALTSLQNALGGNVSVEEGSCTHEGKVVDHISPALSVLLKKCMLESDNLYAEVFLRTLGIGSEDAMATGLSKVASLMRSYGYDHHNYFQVDGSGLSRMDYVSSATLQGLLVHIHADPLFQEYVSYLPVAGVSGTLKYRFKGTPAEGHIRAKTGTLTGVDALSGYADNPHCGGNNSIAFSIIVNGANLPARDVRSAMDQFATHLVSITC